MKKRLSKRYKKLIEAAKGKDPLKVEDAIIKVKKNCTTKFDESVDISILLNLKQKEGFLFLIYKS